jgi:hypothetical protein
MCYMGIKENLQQGMLQHNLEGYELRDNGILMYRRIIYVPRDQGLKILIFSKMHKVPYIRRPSYRKTIIAIKKQYY